MNTMRNVKTAYTAEKEKRDRAIYREYCEIMSTPGAASTYVTAYLMKKYNIHSPATIWSIRRRMEQQERSS